MIEKFTKDIYKNLISSGTERYRHMYESMSQQMNCDGDWGDIKKFYDSLTIQQRNVFFSVIEQTMIDTISGIFGVLDGSSNLNGNVYECDVIVNGIDMDHDLQDYFLSYVETENKTP